jgi:hypothetical protein
LKVGGKLLTIQAYTVFRSLAVHQKTLSERARLRAFSEKEVMGRVRTREEG